MYILTKMILDNIISYNLKTTINDRIIKDIDLRNAYIYEIKAEIYEITTKDSDTYYKLDIYSNGDLKHSNSYLTYSEAQGFVFGYIQALKNIDIDNFKID